MSITRHKKAIFGQFALDVETGELFPLRGKPVRLAEQPLCILLALLEHPAEVISREEIRKRLWPNDTVVEFEHSIRAAINRLRAALKDSPENPQYIETIARRGYRLKVPVRWEGVPETASQPIPRNFDSSLPGKRVSHYRVLGIVGGGGMGVVYRGEDVKLGRAVALKFLAGELAADPLAKQRLMREARAASALNHPNICTVYEVEEHNGIPFIVMELLEGKNLRDILANDGAMSPGPIEIAIGSARWIDIALQVSEGLEAAHRQGLVHRDLKPANVFVQTDGRVKILDFGLAKGSARNDSGHLEVSSNGIPADHLSLDLTRTGASVGTAGYMSPEQVRGEKLDGRSDLFTFGILIYEMAFGKRAFRGETAAELHQAVLTHIPEDIEQANDRLRSILAKTLEKDVESRYQSAATLRADLLAYKRSVERRHWGMFAAISIAAILIIASTSLWIWFRQPRPLGREPKWKQHQLTVGSVENPVTGGAISPDGKYLTFTDLDGIHIKLLSTGESHPVLFPGTSFDELPKWEIGSWLPDSTHFFAIAELPRRPSALWIISLAGGPHRQIATGVAPWDVSPDGSWLAVTTEDDHEIWLLNCDGHEKRRLVRHSDNTRFRAVHWSADGRNLAYVTNIDSPSGKVSQIEVTELSTLKTKAVLTGDAVRELSFLEEGLQDMAWLPDGRLIFVGGEPDIHESSCNLWQVRINDSRVPGTQAPTRLTNWSGFCTNNLSATADGKKLVLTRSSIRSTLYSAGFDPRSMRLDSPARLTLIDDWSSPVGWDAKNNSVLVRSNRDGSWGIYRSHLDQQDTEVLINGIKDMAYTTTQSPDQRWVLYSQPIKSERGPWFEVMRISSSGGVAEEVLRSRTTHIECPAANNGPCVLSELAADHKHLSFISFDVMRGRGSEICEVEVGTAEEPLWALSPDGRQVAMFLKSANHLEILSFANRRTQRLELGSDKALQTVTWSGDGRGFFLSNSTENGVQLLYKDLHGAMRTLWEVRGSRPSLVVRASKDGRRLAIQTVVQESNMWMIEDF